MAKKSRHSGDRKKKSSAKKPASRKGDASLKSSIEALRKTASSARAEASSVQKRSRGIHQAVESIEKTADAVHAKIKTAEAHVADAERQTETGTKRVHKPFFIVGIGASAGGYEAVSQLLEAISSETGMAFVLVQHLDPSHESKLSELLSRSTKMPVVEIRSETVVEPNHVYVIPPNRSLTISEGALQLKPRRGTGSTLAVDEFFQSLAVDQANRAVGVILSGNGTDGTLGLKQIKAEGGITFVQDEQSAKFYSMPGSALHSGCVGFCAGAGGDREGIGARLALFTVAPRKNQQGGAAAAGHGNRAGENFRPLARADRRGFLVLQTHDAQTPHHAAHGSQKGPKPARLPEVPPTESQRSGFVVQ